MRKKVIIAIPAYKAADTLPSVFKRLEKVEEYFDSIIVVDDGSLDETYRVAKKLGEEFTKKSGKPVIVLQHSPNRGYGGSQKTLYSETLKLGGDIAVLVHADGQYPPEELPNILQPLLQGKADVVLGSRALGGEMVHGGMPLTKYLGNRVLTRFENLIVGIKPPISEYHTGYRAFSRKALQKTCFHLNSEKYVFDSEMLIQAYEKGLRIVEVPIPTYYGEEVSYLSPTRYGLGILKVLLTYVLHKLKLRPTLQYS
jgi:glycosyltransferase involved in cell wall biosynthesis